MRKNSFGLILFFFALIFFPSGVYAQESRGITVTPSILRLDLSQETQSEFELIYKNNALGEVLLELSANDFSELEDGWRVKFLADEEAKHYQYSLSSWIEFERRSVSLKPGEEARVKVYINKDELSPGGHYASILANISGIEEDGKQVAIKGALSTLLFVRTHTGQEIEKASISNLSVERSSFFQFPELFILRFNNQGNSELVPFGKLTVTDLLGRDAGTAILNEGGNYSLPESIKKFELKLGDNHSLRIPGYYTARLFVEYGSGPSQIFYDQGFFFIDPISSILLILIIIASIFGIRSSIKKMSKSK